METIINSLEPALQKLSEIFCISIDTIKSNGIQYILMYGKYEWIINMIIAIVISGMISLFSIIVICLIHYENNRRTYDDEPGMPTHNSILKNMYFKYGTRVFIGIILFIIVIFSLPYLICPEVYSIKQVMQLIQ